MSDGDDAEGSDGGDDTDGSGDLTDAPAAVDPLPALP
jgi:hypothetical protein